MRSVQRAVCLINLSLDKLGAMFREEIWWSAVCGVISGIITVLFLKFLENKGLRAGQRGMRGQDDSCKPKKRPQEHDERFC